MKTRFNCSLLIEHDIHGWGSVDQEPRATPAAEQDFLVQLKLGGTAVAQQRRTIQRPDVDKVAGQPGVAKGFWIPALPAAAALAALGKSDGVALTLSFGGEDIDLAAQDPRLLDLSQYRSLRLCDGNAPVVIADVWFASEYELRIRVDKVAAFQGMQPPYKVRFYQPDYVPGLRFALIGETEAAADKMALLSPFLRNPLLPLLITVATANGDTVTMDLIAFPSLCRGGLHHAELQAMATSRGYMSDLRAASDRLLHGMASAGRDKSTRVDGLRLDMRGATGAERIFSPIALQWLVLAQDLRIEVAAPHAGADGQEILDTALAAAGLARPKRSGRKRAGLSLALAADSLPAIAALAARHMPAKDGAPIACSFVTADAATGIPRWHVSIPAGPAWLEALQPPQVAALSPMLAGNGRSKSRPVGPLVSAAMAVRFMDESFKSDETRILPVAPDRARVLADSAGLDPETRVTAVVSVRNGAPALRDLLTSLAAQTVADRAGLVIVNNRSHGSARTAIEAAAAEFFPGRFTILDYDAPFNLGAQSNLGAAAAAGSHLCFVDSGVVLHDPRCLETLLLLAQPESVATVGCMLLEPRQGKAETVKFRSAGTFPAGLTFGGRAKVSYAEPDCGAVFGPAVYPVAANSFVLSVVRRDHWNSLGGLDTDRLANDHGDVDFGIRAMAGGLVNLCTTAVSAFHAGRASRGTAFDILASDQISVPDLAMLLSNCTVLRRIG